MNALQFQMASVGQGGPAINACICSVLYLTAVEQQLIDNNFSRATRIYRDQSGTHTALKNKLHQKYSPEFWTEVVQPGTGIATISLLDMYTHLYANYGQVT